MKGSRICIDATWWSVLFVVVVLSLSVGCATVETNRELPTQPLLPFTDSGQAIQPGRWWTEFGNEDLNVLVEQALGQNFDLAVALQRLRAARAVVRREASDLVPDLDGVLGTPPKELDTTPYSSGIHRA